MEPEKTKKYKSIPSESFKRGAELICYNPRKLNGKQKDKKIKDIEGLKAQALSR
jgi:hypothetical protein